MRVVFGYLQTYGTMLIEYLCYVYQKTFREVAAYMIVENVE